MNFTIPTVEDIVLKYQDHDAELSQEEALEAKRAELDKLKKDELIEMILKAQANRRTDTVQDLAKAILKDEELIAASYEDIANAIQELKPGSKTSSKSIASYVSKKRDEWDLPPRIRITRAKTTKPEEEA